MPRMVSRATCTITSPSSSTSWRLETGKKVYTTNHKSYSRQQFEEELGLAVVGGQGVVSGNRVLDHQVADECDVKLGTPVAVTGEKRPKYALMYY